MLLDNIDVIDPNATFRGLVDYIVEDYVKGLKSYIS